MKKLIKSKTFWTGLGTVGYGVYLIIQGQQDIGVQTVLAGMAMIFLRSAVNKNNNS